MNILISDSWLREYLDTKVTPEKIKECLSLCGPSVEKIEKRGNDFIYQIEITTNRIDTVSIYGIAREATAILPRFGFPAQIKPIVCNPSLTFIESLPLIIEDPEKLCSRLLAIVLTDINLKPSSPLIKKRLEASGVRSLNNLIDITNYCMLELGHPCHVFDYDRIKTGKLILRRAKRGEKLVTLDNKECILDTQDVVIDDGENRIIDLPGIIGTSNSVVTDKTRRAVLFIESNDPTTIRKTSMRLGIRTLAATINEKHPDPECAKIVLLHAIELAQIETRGKVASSLIDIYPHKQQPKSVTVSFDFIQSRLGIQIPKREIEEILTSLGFSFTTTSHDLAIVPPSFRQFDVTLPEDIVEEVARIYGYHNLPTSLMAGNIPQRERQKDLESEEEIKRVLKYWGYTETYSYSFISKKLIEKVHLNPDAHIKIKNPLTEDTEYMRTSLLPSLLTVVAQNQHMSETLSLFELSNVYHPTKNDLPYECSMLALATQSDFYHLKGVISTLLTELGLGDITFATEVISPFFHPKQSIRLLKENTFLGVIGKLHPSLSFEFSEKKDLFIAELNLFDIFPLCNLHKIYRQISPYIPVKEDFTFYLTHTVPIGDIIDEIKKGDTYIQSVRFKGRFGKNITLEVTYHNPKKNVTKEETQKIREKILARLNKKWGLSLKD